MLASCARRFGRNGIQLAALATLVLLCGCHASITYRVDLRPDHSALVTLKTVMDDQFYSTARSQNSAAFDAPAGAGWTQTNSVDDDGDHVILLSKIVPANAVGSLGLPQFGNDSAASTPTNLLSSLHTDSGLFTDRTSFETQVPALMPKPDPSNPYAAAGAAMAASIVSFHFVVSTPGKVLNTNGEALPDGGTQWTLSLTSPTMVRYEVETLDVSHIIIAIGCVVVLIIAAVVLLNRRRRSSSTPSQSMIIN